MAHPQNYTLGRGKIYFSRFMPNTQIPAGFYYIGNSPEFNLTIEVENLDHYSSDEGLRELDLQIPLQVNRTGSFTTDSIRPKNVALFFFGDASTVATTAATGLTETIDAVMLGHGYRLGATPTNPTGYFGIDPVGFAVTDGSATTSATGTVTLGSAGTAADTVAIGGQIYTLVSATPTNPNEVLIGATATDTAANLAAAINAGAGSGTVYGTGTVANPYVTATPALAVVTLDAKSAGTAGNSVTLVEVGTSFTTSGSTLTGGSGTAYVSGTDFVLQADFGMVEFLEGGSITEGQEVEITYSVKGSTRPRMISGSKPVEGALTYKAQNAEGTNIHYYMPFVKIAPNGDYALKGDEWQTIPFTISIMKPTVGPAILADGDPIYQ